MGWMRSSRSALPLLFAAAVVMLGLSAGSTRQNGEEPAWIEIIESYTVPADPFWRQYALEASSVRSVREAGSVERATDYRERRERAQGNKRSLEAINAAESKELSSFATAGGKERALVVVRAWDGIRRQRKLIVLGEKQRSIAERCRPGQVVAVELGRSNVPDHFQAAGRLTVGRFLRVGGAPSDFLYAKDGAPDLLQAQFVQQQIAPGSPESRLATATKQQGAGNGVIEIAVPFNAGLGVDPLLPWFCEFRLWELDAQGKRVAEVKFSGTRYLVHAPPIAMRVDGPSSGPEFGGVTGKRTPDEIRWVAPKEESIGAEGCVARARVEVRKPTPFGYEAELVNCSGVRLQVAAAGAAAPSGGSGAPAPSP